MYTEDVRRKKSVAKTIESLVFMRFPKDPSPMRLRSFKRKEKLSRLCAVILAVVMLIGISVEIGKFVDIAVINKNIKALQADNRLLEVSISNLQVELMMKTQDSVVCYLAARDLGMIRVDKSQIMVLPTSGTHDGMTQLVSSGFQQ